MATILPPGVTQFFDANGNPLAGGFVYFYVPNTTTPKDTWQDSDQSILNENPIELSGGGTAIIYGSGIYRQVVEDVNGNLIFDAITSDTASSGISFGGTSTGSSNAQIITPGSFTSQNGQVITFIAGFTNTSQLTVNAIPVLADTGIGPAVLVGGEVVDGNSIMMLYDSTRGAFHLINGIETSLIPAGTMVPYTINSTTAPSGYAFANGQTLARADNVNLWAAVQGGDNLAATEGAKTAGQYGPGNGTSTFSVPNLYSGTADGGYFIRPISSLRAIGTVQADDFKSHNHPANFTGTAVPDHIHGIPAIGSGAVSNQSTLGGNGPNFSLQTDPAGGHTPSGSVAITPTGGTETRPKNIAYPVIIKL